MTRKNLEWIAIGDLSPWATNARTHSKKQIRQISESIEAFGFTNPVLIDERRTILAGHGRVAGAQLLGMTEVPCLRLDHMSDDEKRAYVLADNKLALNAGWDEDLLAAELGALMSAGFDFDVSITGFSIPAIEGVLEAVAPEEPGIQRMTPCLMRLRHVCSWEISGSLASTGWSAVTRWTRMLLAR